MSLVAEERIRQLFITRGHPGRDGIDSISSGSMSPDLGEMWPPRVSREPAVGGWNGTGLW